MAFSAARGPVAARWAGVPALIVGLAGGFALTRTGPRRWVLVKVRDSRAREGSDITAERPASVRSGRTWEELARERAGPG